MARTFLCSTRLLLDRSLRSSSSSQKTITSHHYIDPRFQQTLRAFSSTSSRLSLMEFFDDPVNFGEKAVKSGRAWRMDELRIKSNSDLHKLWFILYKERNMLYTMQEASLQSNELFPSPERIDKVEESMANLENIVRERNKAYWDLEVSPCATGERPKVFRRDIFGRPRWHMCSQHIVPYMLNRQFRNAQGPAHDRETHSLFRKYREMKQKHYNHHRSKIARHIRNLLRRFPDADIDYIAELHPELPPGYVKHLRDNIHLYVHDPPSRHVGVSLIKAKWELENNKEEKLLV